MSRPELLAVLLAAALAPLTPAASKSDPDIGLDFTAIVRARGYPVETHAAVTEDGYILQLFRIPDGISRTMTGTTKPVVFLNHALLDSSWAFVANFPTESLGFILADAGYDVWFGNNRGNTYSRNHTTLSPDSAAYWNFSYDEMARFDLPAHLQYVLNYTSAANLSYVGHSQGTMQAFAGFSLEANHAIAERVNLFVALAPVAYLGHQRSSLLNAIAKLGVDEIIDHLGEFFTGKFLNQFGSKACHLMPNGCDDFIEAICGPSNHLNTSRISVYVGQTPAGTSVKNMMHFAQGIRHGGFRVFDYGEAGNLEKYGVPAPPTYNVSALKVPTVLCTGGSDYLADALDVTALESALDEGVIVKRIDLPTYAHLDFSWGVDAHTLLYPQLMELLSKASGAAGGMGTGEGL